TGLGAGCVQPGAAGIADIRPDPFDPGGRARHRSGDLLRGVLPAAQAGRPALLHDPRHIRGSRRALRFPALDGRRPISRHHQSRVRNHPPGKADHRAAASLFLGGPSADAVARPKDLGAGPGALDRARFDRAVPRPAASAVRPPLCSESGGCTAARTAPGVYWPGRAGAPARDVLTMRILVVSNLYPPYYVGGYALGCPDVEQAV